jgi:hypothetical protein
VCPNNSNNNNNNNNNNNSNETVKQANHVIEDRVQKGASH